MMWFSTVIVASRWSYRPSLISTLSFYDAERITINFLVYSHPSLECKYEYDDKGLWDNNAKNGWCVLSHNVKYVDIPHSYDCKYIRTIDTYKPHILPHVFKKPKVKVRVTRRLKTIE